MKALKYIVSGAFLAVGAILIAISAPQVESWSEVGFRIGGDPTDFTPQIDQSLASSVTRVDLNADVAIVNVQKGETFSVTCEGIVEEDFELEINGNELEIEYDRDKFISFGFGGDVGTITVTLPEKVYEEISIEQGVGEIYVSDIECNILKIDCGVGESNYRNIKAASCDVEIGVGECEIRDSLLGSAKIGGGVGDFTINNSDFTVGCVIEGGVGEINLNLISDTYSVRADNGIGNVVFNGEKVSSKTGSGTIVIDAECGVGDININTGV